MCQVCSPLPQVNSFVSSLASVGFWLATACHSSRMQRAVVVGRKAGRNRAELGVGVLRYNCFLTGAGRMS